jgi:hypothetical protein
MGFDTSLRGEPLIVVSALQSFKEPRIGLSLSRTADPLEVPFLVSTQPK